MQWILLVYLGSLMGLVTILILLFLFRRMLLDWGADRFLIRFMTDSYKENMWDVVLGVTRMTPHILMETELRAENPALLERPLGTIVRTPSLTQIAFNPAQLVRHPLGPLDEVDLSVSLGPRAAIPLQMRTPIMVSAMSYGIAMSKPFVLAVAKGSAEAGVVYNAGSGPPLEELLDAADQVIVQFSGGEWSQDPEVLRRADMIEVRIGHGARGALGSAISPDRLPPEVVARMSISPSGLIIQEAPIPGTRSLDELRRLVPYLRQLIGGRPVGVKLCATHDLEGELAMLLEAGVDVIAIDGAEGGTHGSPPVLADDFGIPSAHALVRAVSFLERTGARQMVSLVLGGGLRTPGEMLKALALGADAVYVGTAAMMATTHGQLSKSTPFEPITQICWATGAKVDQFDADEGARTLANFLLACEAEMAEALRALGKRSLRELDRSVLVARDAQTAAWTGLPPSWQPGSRG